VVTGQKKLDRGRNRGGEVKCKKESNAPRFKNVKQGTWLDFRDTGKERQGMDIFRVKATGGVGLNLKSVSKRKLTLTILLGERGGYVRIKMGEKRGPDWIGFSGKRGRSKNTRVRTSRYVTVDTRKSDQAGVGVHRALNWARTSKKCLWKEKECIPRACVNGNGRRLRTKIYIESRGIGAAEEC